VTHDEREELKGWMVLTAKEAGEAAADKTIQYHSASCPLRPQVEGLMQLKKFFVGVLAVVLAAGIVGFGTWLLVTYQAQGAHAAGRTPTTQPARVP
jgi:hypothetical protein